MTALAVLRPLRLLAFCCVFLSTSAAFAQSAKREIENLVPPGGAAFDIPVHAGEVCILSFPENMAKSALSSSADFEIKAWGGDGVAVRGIGRSATTTLALATVSGKIKVNVTLHVVSAKQDALTLVRFKSASSEEVFAAKLKIEVDKRVAPVEAELAASKRGIDVQIRDRADGLIAERLLKRNEVIALHAHERNDNNVIAHVERAILLGDDGYVFFQLENRSGAAFRLAHVAVSSDGKVVSGPARLFSTAIDKDPAVVGVVPAGAIARGVVVVRGADQVLGKSLQLDLADPDGSGAIHLTRGISLK